MTKDEAREAAINWQHEASNTSLSYGELADAQAYFTKLGEEHGLTDEFKENGII